MFSEPSSFSNQKLRDGWIELIRRDLPWQWFATFTFKDPFKPLDEDNESPVLKPMIRIKNKKEKAIYLPLTTENMFKTVERFLWRLHSVAVGPMKAVLVKSSYEQFAVHALIKNETLNKLSPLQASHKWEKDTRLSHGICVIKPIVSEDVIEYVCKHINPHTLSSTVICLK